MCNTREFGEYHHSVNEMFTANQHGLLIVHARCIKEELARNTEGQIMLFTEGVRANMEDMLCVYNTWGGWQGVGDQVQGGATVVESGGGNDAVGCFQPGPPQTITQPPADLYVGGGNGATGFFQQGPPPITQTPADLYAGGKNGAASFIQQGPPQSITQLPADLYAGGTGDDHPQDYDIPFAQEVTHKPFQRDQPARFKLPD
ncbi:hypothetical protein FIBSPDRAFT_890501 [Athelia psychrophila]|uniref:Uncharacterized protein n=1 Tax=Athelia psychrophila TaxID=1759441 RepID=A0A166KYW4_9AGAM|nr:hypothetical protein FIBSPDRAFT_890501 [Fibularhizoctonia sp. CBS 109695]